MRKPKSEAAHGWDRDQCFQEENSMSSPIAPTTTPAGPTAAPSPTGVHGAAAAAAPPPTDHVAAALEPALSLEAIPSAPPPEVLEQMATAAETYERLHSQGRELRFAHDEHSGRTTIEVRDRRGNVLSRLSPAQALDVAAGAPLVTGAAPE
jgi:hypothetical protein